jgi:hypothetical protein
MDQPIACTLTSAELDARIGDLAALARTALLTREPLADGERLTFTGDDATERELRAVAAAEASCCAFLALDLRRHHDRLVLDVTGPPDARPIIQALFAATPWPAGA